jgi:hypothetical protein
MTALECLIWLDELRTKYPTVEEAAKAFHVSRNSINHHCRRPHGMSFPEWITTQPEKKKAV